MNGKLVAGCALWLATAALGQEHAAAAAAAAFSVEDGNAFAVVELRGFSATRFAALVEAVAIATLF